MSYAEKKMRTLGLRGGVMYMSRAQLKVAREKFPAAIIVRFETDAHLPQGFHAYVVENWKELAANA